MKILRHALLGFAILLLLAGVVIKLGYGLGRAYPDLSRAPLVAPGAVEQLVSLDYPPGNVAVSAGGRIFFNYHPFAKAGRFGVPTVFELVAGHPRPYPDAAFQARYQGVFGMTVDQQQRLWLIEPASLDHPRTRLLAFDLRRDRLVFEHWFAAGEARFAQDLRVSPDGRTVFLADTGLFRFTPPALIVFDVATGHARPLLADEPATQPQDWVIQTPYGPHRLGFGLVTFSVGLDGIALSPDGRWLYFGAMSNDTLYRVPTAALTDARLTPAALHARIEPVGHKPLSDGIALDAAGNVLITDIEHGGLARMNPTGALETLVKRPGVVWADGVAVAPDGSVLFTDSAIPAYVDQLARPPAADRLVAARPYAIYRVRP